MREIGLLKKKLGKRCFAAVMDSLPDTKTAAMELARKHKRKRATLKATAETICELVEAYEVAKRVKREEWKRMVPQGQRFYSRDVYTRGWKPGAQPTLKVRLEASIEWRVQRAFDGNLRSYARQEDTEVSRTAFFERANATLRKDEGWIDYKDKNRYGVVSAQYTIRVMRGWTLLPGWVRVCDGMPTLAALRCPDDETDHETVYRAKWVRNSRGDIVVREGFIVRQERDGRTYTAHGKSIGAARSSITRQQPEWLQAEDERQRERALRIERAKSKVLSALERGSLNGYDVPVSFADSIRAGNCPDGTTHWIERHFPGQDEAMVSDILDVDDQRERALLACVAAIRRQRPEQF